MRERRLRSAAIATMLTLLGSFLWVAVYHAVVGASDAAPAYLRDAAVEATLRREVFEARREADVFFAYVERYARRSGVSIALEYEPELMRGAFGAARARPTSPPAHCAPGRVASLAGRAANCRDVLYVTFVGKPRLFYLRGAGRVRDKLALRGALAKISIRKRQYAYFSDRDPLALEKTLRALEGDLTRPLSPFLDAAPAGEVSRWLSLGALRAVHEMPAIYQRSVSKLSMGAAQAISRYTEAPIFLIYALTIGVVVLLGRRLLFLMIDAVLDDALGARRWSKAARESVGFALKIVVAAAFVFAPFLFFSFLVYGDLTDLISFSDVSSEKIGALERATFRLNTTSFDIPREIALPAAFCIVFAQVFDIYRRRTWAEFLSDDWAETIGSIGFTGGVAALVSFPAAFFFVLASIPATLFFALVSLEGPTGALFLLYAGSLTASRFVYSARAA